MGKYAISPEFGVFRYFKPPIGRTALAAARKIMRAPRFIWRDGEIKAEKFYIPSYDGAELELLLLTPRQPQNNAPCLVYLHGGGFVFEAAHSHYALALRYARALRCTLVFVRYRLAPAHPHPVFFEDCYAALAWVYSHAQELKIDAGRIGIGGDSAGAALAAGVCMMARDRALPCKICFQLLVYPYLDARNDSDSARKFTDTPMWNSSLSARIGAYTKPDPQRPDYAYYSPVEAESVCGLPPAYIETAEFDCLHDDGILYAKRLLAAGIEVEVYETRGTMHGFDIALNAPITLEAVSRRVEFMRKRFIK